MPSLWFFSYEDVCLWMWAHERRCPERQDVSDPLELELQAVVIYLKRVQGMELGSSKRTVHTLLTSKLFYLSPHLIVIFSRFISELTVFLNINKFIPGTIGNLDHVGVLFCFFLLWTKSHSLQKSNGSLINSVHYLKIQRPSFFSHGVLQDSIRTHWSSALRAVQWTVGNLKSFFPLLPHKMFPIEIIL